jgi:hypothetical protein
MRPRQAPTRVVLQCPRTDAVGGLNTIAVTGRLDAVEQPGHQWRLAEGDIDPGQGDQDEQRGQHEQHTGDDATPGTVHQPADVGRQLLGFRPGQHHAVVEGVQEAPLGNPATLLDQFLMHHRNLPGRPAKAHEAELEPEQEGLPELSARVGNKIILKREDMQPVFSFKIRGAYNKIASLSPEKLKRGVICASAGNHAQGVAMSAAKVGCRAVIVMPTSTPGIKIDAVKARGGEVVLFGDGYDDAYAHALELEKTEKLTFVHPFDDPEVIAGQGTIAMEILRQHSRHNGPIHAIFCCVGGGGLLAGVAAYIKRLRPEIKIIGVETIDADAMTQSIAKGQACAP